MHRATSGNDVNRFLHGAVEVKGVGAFAGSELEQLGAELVAACVASKLPGMDVKLALSRFGRLDLITVDDVRVSSVLAHDPGIHRR